MYIIFIKIRSRNFVYSNECWNLYWW